MAKASLLFLVLVVLVSLCFALQDNLISPKKNLILRSWDSLGRLPSSQILSLNVALKQRNIQVLEQIVHSVSDPRSSDYGKYLELDQISELISPTEESISIVQEYFRQLGAQEQYLTLSRDFLVVKVSAEQLESALDVEFHVFAHKGSKRLLFRTLDSYTLPEEIAQRIDVITGLSDFPDYPHERRSLNRKKRSQNKFEASTSDPSSPYISRVSGSEDLIDVIFVPYCTNGNTTNDPQQPCSDYPPVIQEVTFQISPDNYPIITATENIQNLNCASSAGSVTCHYRTHIPKFVRTNISAASTFANGKQSSYLPYAVKHSPSPYVFPSTLHNLYNIPTFLKGTNPNNSQAVVAFEQQYISLKDLSTFFSLMGLPQATPNIHGVNNESFPGAEATLDIQYVMAMGRGINTTFWSVSGDVGNGGYILEWALQVNNYTSAPLVTSISYGDTEDGYYNKFGSFDYIYRMETELMKMAARGYTVLAGSGDAGASNVGEAGNDLSPTDPTCTPLRPFYPSNSPYVTSVSSTFLGVNALPICTAMTELNDPVACGEVGEIAVGLRQGTYWTTGGGFSNMSTNPTPDWQSTQVEAYLKNNADRLPPSSIWNSSGRGYPDISTVGFNIPIVWGGQIFPIGGTSSSGPIMAGIISLLNDQRLNLGLPTVGWINPFLYQTQLNYPDAFQDVTVGENIDGDLQSRYSVFPSFCEYGFSTDVGWDPVTGLGTPNFQRLNQLLTS